MIILLVCRVMPLLLILFLIWKENVTLEGSWRSPVSAHREQKFIGEERAILGFQDGRVKSGGIREPGLVAPNSKNTQANSSLIFMVCKDMNEVGLPGQDLGVGHGIQFIRRQPSSCMLLSLVCLSLHTPIIWQMILLHQTLGLTYVHREREISFQE